MKENKKPVKLLYILNVANRVNNFSYASMVAAKELGVEFHIAGNWSYETIDDVKNDEEKYGITIHQIDFVRTPYHPANVKAYKQLKKLVEAERFDVIHCNTPIGGVLGRLVGKKCNTPKIIYQAHGFHFFKGAPLKNWVFYYPVERWLARYTDVLVTINKEDHALAEAKLKLRNGGKTYKVSGVGIDTNAYVAQENARIRKRNELGLKDEEIAIISMGDLIKRKNYDTAIRAISEAQNARLQYYICGRGPQEKHLEKLASNLGVSDQVHFLGFRTDVKELLAAADIFFFTTRQEGLPRSMMEAMASGLPCVASKIRGNIDLLDNVADGYLCQADDISSYAEMLNELESDTEKRKANGESSRLAIQNFETKAVIKEMVTIYSREIFGH